MKEFMNKLVLRYPKLLVGFSWLISVCVAVLVFVVADFGGPAWIFILCGLWLCSLGLPTTLSAVALAAIWGNIAGLGTPSLSTFVIVVAVVSLAVQAMSVLVVVRALRRWDAR